MAEMNSNEYYVNRERLERGLAKDAVDPAIREIHLEMARRYAALIEESDPPLRQGVTAPE